jgi:hypothetical protein
VYFGRELCVSVRQTAVPQSRLLGPLRAYSVEKLQYLDFENFRQKHTFAELQ